MDQGQRGMEMSHLAERVNQCIIGESPVSLDIKHTSICPHGENRGRSLIPQ